MFQTIADSISVDGDYPERARKLALYQKILEGTFYCPTNHAEQ